MITDGPRPKHAQLRDALAELAMSEGPDVAIPSERELMARHKVSRATVRKAIDGLVSDGVLQRIHGKGTFVARPRVESRLHLASFSQDMRRRGLEPSTRALGIELEDPPADLVRKDPFFNQQGLRAEDYRTPEQVADLLVRFPRLMQRPVLVRGSRAIIGRPKDRVDGFLAG